jgi:hypothetical protein
MEKRYRVLRFMALMYQVLGVLVPILALIAVFVLRSSSLAVSTIPVNQNELLLGGLISIFLPALLTGIFLFGTGQLFMVLIHIEENTRRTSLLLGKRASRSS